MIMQRRTFVKSLAAGLAMPLLPLPLASQATVQSTSSNSSLASPTAANDTLRLLLVACGGAGLAMCRSIDSRRQGLAGVLALDTSQRALIQAPLGSQQWLIADAKARKPTTAGQAYRATLACAAELSAAIADSHGLIIVAGTGGAAGSGIAQAMHELAARQGVGSQLFLTRPFAFESVLRQRVAAHTFAALQAQGAGILDFDLNTASTAAGPQATVGEVIDTAAVALDHYLWQVSGSVQTPGLVGIDYADVQAVMTHPTQAIRSCLGWGDGCGAQRVAVAMAQALPRALLASGRQPVHGIGVAIQASRETLKLRELNQVMLAVRTALGDQALTMFSASHDQTLGDALRVSVVVGRLA